MDRLKCNIHSFPDGKEPGWVIKSADKVGAVVLWGRDSYIKQADRQLSVK